MGVFILIQLMGVFILIFILIMGVFILIHPVILLQPEKCGKASRGSSSPVQACRVCGSESARPPLPVLPEAVAPGPGGVAGALFQARDPPRSPTSQGKARCCRSLNTGFLTLVRSALLPV